MSIKKAAPDFADVLIPASPKEGFLIKVEQVIDWQPLEKILTKTYRDPCINPG